MQVLFAFLLTVPFTQGWQRVTGFQEDVYFASLLCSAPASAFLIAPLFVVLWYTIPLVMRARGGRDAA